MRRWGYQNTMELKFKNQSLYEMNQSLHTMERAHSERSEYGKERAGKEVGEHQPNPWANVGEMDDVLRDSAMSAFR